MSTTKHDLLSLLFIYKKYPLLNLILVLPENQWAAGPAKVTIGLYISYPVTALIMRRRYLTVLL